MNSFRIGMNAFRIKLSKGTILDSPFLLSTAAAAWKFKIMLPDPFPT